MPIEIKELLIKTRIEKPVATKEASKDTGAKLNKAELIEECVEAVLDRLREMNER